MSVIINGSAGVTTNSGAVYDSLQRATAVTASGTSVDFTGIPSWVKRITVMFSGVSTGGTALVAVQLGDSGGIENTGYTGNVSTVQNSAATISTALSSAFVLAAANAASSIYDGIATITNISGNNWAFQSVTGAANNQIGTCGGSKTLSGTLDRLRITTGNGTDTFDAGTINIIYE